MNKILDVKPGDDIVISGIAEETNEDYICIRLPSGWTIWVNRKDVKTIRPQGNGGKAFKKEN